jgi:shikimate dehydrogenase
MQSSADRYAVIGHPIAHSRSPWIHAQFARQTGEQLSYSALDIAPAGLSLRLIEFFAQGGRGLNVTVPHKQAVLPFLSQLSERARIAGAVNVIARHDDGALHGDNTDGSGFVRDLTHNLRIELRGWRVLLLGAGGAARGLLAPLLALGPAQVVIVNRTADRAVQLAQQFAAHGPIHGSGFDGLGSERFELIINATAAGLDGKLPPAPVPLLRQADLCYDLAYGGGNTPFVRWAREHGVARCVDGTGMLVEQAADSFQIWRGVRPDTGPVLAALAA